MTDETTKMSGGKKAVIGMIAALLILTAAAYGYGVYYFTNHFLPGSAVNGLNCSYLTEAETEALLAKQTEAYVLTVNTRNNGREAITAEQAGLSYVPNGEVGKLMKGQDRYKWFLAFNQKQTYETASSVTIDESLLKKAVSELNCMQEVNIIKPVDAYIAETEDGFTIFPEKEGTALRHKKTIQVIQKAVEACRLSIDLDQEGCYIKPKVYRNDEQLVKDCKQMNKLTKAIITYDFGDRSEVVDRSVIKNWLVRNKKGNYTLDKKLVADYVYNLGYKYDTFGCTRTFLTYDGREKVIEGGDYGWAIDQAAETEALIKAIKDGTIDVREPVYAYKGWSRNTNDIGYTYIEIDLTNQRMVFYKDGAPIVDTPVVTGNPNVDGNETPTGCFAVDAMMSPYVLKGEGYAAPVTYWMPFSGNVGVHDASWRTEFGGNLYLLDGSHGCVNTPYSQAEIIYRNIDIGAPVVVYK